MVLALDIRGTRYDCTEFAARHPGGRTLLVMLDGQDATAHFDAVHGGSPGAERALALLPRAGRCVPRPSRIARKLERLRGEMGAAQLFTPDPAPYAARALVLTAVLTAALSTGHVATSALLFAFFLQQCAFIGHDAGHNSVFATRRANARLGLFVGNLCTGVSIGWWKSTHNMHHAATNSLAWDPDIQHAPVLVVDRTYLAPAGVFSKFHGRWLTATPRQRAIARFQHWYFYPLMLVARFNLYWQSARFACGPDAAAGEAVALLLYHAGLAAWACSWGTPARALAWFGLSHALAGILHVQIALSHFSMPCYPGPVHAGERFLRVQLAGTTDLAVPGWCAWFHGGLQYQATHHVFPRVPRDKLAAARARLVQFCRVHGIPYHSMGWWHANAALLQSLAAQARVGDTHLLRAAWSAVG